VLYGSIARSSWATLTDEEMVEAEKELLENWDGVFTGMVAHFAPSMVDDRQFADWCSRVIRASASPGAIIALRRMNRLIDFRDRLPLIGTPTLVLHRIGDRDVPIEEGRYLSRSDSRRVLARAAGRRSPALAG
jgi:pimeloyl-ACP methyl ester carboxylesterase